MTALEHGRDGCQCSVCVPVDVSSHAGVCACRDCVAGCVGFADCPCKRCRAKRAAVTASHPDHDRRDVSYCGACLQAERDRHDARRFAAMRPSYREFNPARNDRPAS